MNIRFFLMVLSFNIICLHASQTNLITAPHSDSSQRFAEAQQANHQHNYTLKAIALERDNAKKAAIAQAYTDLQAASTGKGLRKIVSNMRDIEVDAPLRQSLQEASVQLKVTYCCCGPSNLTVRSAKSTLLSKFGAHITDQASKIELPTTSSNPVYATASIVGSAPFSQDDKPV